MYTPFSDFHDLIWMCDERGVANSPHDRKGKFDLLNKVSSISLESESDKPYLAHCCLSSWGSELQSGSVSCGLTSRCRFGQNPACSISCPLSVWVSHNSICLNYALQ